MGSNRKSVLVLLLALYAAGCSNVKLAPVSGRVLYKDEGVTAGSIYFVPDTEKGNKGSGGSSILQLDGSFTITNPEEGKKAVGLRPGPYKITVKCAHQAPEFALIKDGKTSKLAFDVPEAGLPNLIIKVDELGAKD